MDRLIKIILDQIDYMKIDKIGRPPKKPKKHKTMIRFLTEIYYFATNNYP